MGNDPALTGAIHSTKMPGVVGNGVVPDWSVEEINVISTKPLGSPPVHSMVRGVSRDIDVPMALWLVHLKEAAADVTGTLAEKAPTFEPPGADAVNVPGS